MSLPKCATNIPIVGCGVVVCCTVPHTSRFSLRAIVVMKAVKQATEATVATVVVVVVVVTEVMVVMVATSTCA